MIDLGINLFQEIAALGGGGGGFSVTNSLRFNDNDSAILTRTPSVAGNRKTWTWSGWVKRGNLAASGFYTLFEARNGSLAPYGLFYFYDDEIRFLDSFSGIVSSSAKLRDTSGWYHLICVVDTTQATASDRVKIYVNGEQVTSFSTATYPSLNQDLTVNTTYPHTIGSQPQPTDFFDGYMAEVNFIDGQALTPNAFGKIDSVTGEWSPKKYEGTYGTNGFYLEFKDGAALGDDTSGNTNDWTPTNLASTDQMLDTPTNNFSVLNPLDKSAALILSEGNLKTFLSSPPGDDVIAYGTVGVSSGKWYMETTLNAFSYSGNGAAGIFGMHDGSDRLGATYSTGSTSWFAYSEGAFSALGFSGSAVGTVMQIAIDLDAGKLWVGKDGVWNGSGDPDTGANPDRTFTPSGTYKMIAEPYRDVSGYWLLTVNAGADSSFAGIKTRQGNTDANGIGDFYYTPPTGYLALCTDNLPEPTIVDSETQFNVVLDTGANIKATAEAVFDSSLVWIKDRANSNNHQLIDTVRGTGVLQSNTTAAETTYSAPSGNSVAWVWKAGGTAVSNTDGSITSQVSANVNAGFSIVSYTATTNPDAIGHGLGVAPNLIIAKTRNVPTNWSVYHQSLGNTQGIYLNLTSAAVTSSFFWNNTSPTSSVFTSYGSAGDPHIAYCFAEVEGFSKIGTYVGNGSADGPFVYTGFKPAFVLYKRAIGGTGNWILADNKREGYNGDNPALYPNLDLAESSGTSIDLLSNGFKILNPNTDHNASGSTYIYMAFAESPFKNSVAR